MVVVIISKVIYFPKHLKNKMIPCVNISTFLFKMCQRFEIEVMKTGVCFSPLHICPKMNLSITHNCFQNAIGLHDTSQTRVVCVYQGKSGSDGDYVLATLTLV